MNLSLFELFAPIIAVVGLAYSFVFWSQVQRAPSGNEQMHKVAHAIATGARAFIRRQYNTITWLALAVAVGMLAVYGMTGNWEHGVQTAGAFLLGAFLSGLSGVVSMVVATKANLKTAASSDRGLNAALQMALRAGTVSAIAITAFSLLGISALYVVYRIILGYSTEIIPQLIVGYGFGASFVALFAQLGGGIYTKAADVGADLVGKIEAGIPEDDPRNPAVVADLVGDNVGDCAGRGADLFESISAENIGAMVLGVALYPYFGMKGILFPLVFGALGLVASVIGVYVVRTKGNESPMKSMTRGFWVTAILMVGALYGACQLMLNAQTANGGTALWFFFAGLTGIITSILFVYITDYYTGKNHRPVQAIAQASTTGHATNIISGTAIGMESTALTVVVVCAALYISYWFGEQTGIHAGGLYGTAVGTMGMLATVAYILAMDMFGPITDNAGGIVEMAKCPDSMRTVTDELDATGNTTKALTKGYAVGSAALAAFLLFSAYMEEADVSAVNLADVTVFVGAFLGGMIVFFFTSLAIRAVGRAASVIVEEVRRQFREKKGIMDGSEEPDYAAAVDIATRSALREMVIPGVVAVLSPIVIGLVLGKEAVAGMLMVGTIVGILVAAYLNNAGGAWDNAKKYIEGGVHGGKRSPAHQAAVTGDTVGDPFKDTAGPSLHVLIKLFSTLTLALAALFM
jgi:K(+)-stimulated pyrophosphate-energized sodium pump